MTLNLSLLEDSNSPSFAKELKKAPKSLTSQQEKQFYSTVLKSFKTKNLDESKGNLILLTLCKLFYSVDNSGKSKHIGNFVKGNFLLELPYDNSLFTDQLFDLLYIVATQSPQAFDSETGIAPLFRKIIIQNPSKSLFILCLLAQKFGDINSPWGTFDLLFKCSKHFIEKCPENYISILVYLCRIDASFLQGRGQICLEKIIGVLTQYSDNFKLAKIAYTGLIKIYDCDPSFCESISESCQIPNSIILKHLAQQILQPPIVSYLLRVPPALSESGTNEIVEILVELAHETSKASYILIKLSQVSVKIATYLVKNSSWMGEQLYTQYFTTCLVASCFTHKKLRSQILLAPEFVAFLKNAVEDEDQGTVSPIMVILRRLEIDEPFIMKLEKFGVLSALVNKAQSLENDGHINCALLIFNVFSAFDFANAKKSPDFGAICGFLVAVLKQQTSNMNLAAEVIKNYAHIPQCAQVFKKKGVPQFFNKTKGDKTFQKIAKQFASIIQ